MSEVPKVPVNAKIPVTLNIKLLDAVNSNDYKDKTDCITQALEKLLSNTHQSPLFNDDVIREKDEEILRITQELRATQTKLDELQEVLRVLPDPVEIAVIQARDEVLRELLQEKERSIERLEREVSRLDRITYYFTIPETKQVTEPRNTEIIHRNTVSDGLIKKTCKQCGNTFLTGNIRKETCSQKCRSAFSERNKKERL